MITLVSDVDFELHHTIYKLALRLRLRNCAFWVLENKLQISYLRYKFTESQYCLGIFWRSLLSILWISNVSESCATQKQLHKPPVKFSTRRFLSVKSVDIRVQNQPIRSHYVRRLVNITNVSRLCFNATNDRSKYNIFVFCLTWQTIKSFRTDKDVIVNMMVTVASISIAHLRIWCTHSSCSYYCHMQTIAAIWKCV